MGRDITADKTPLLMNAEQNIGNSEIVNPQAGNAGVVIPQTNPQRIIMLTGGSAVGQTVSIVMGASRIVGAANPYPGFAGPITGVVEYGNGGRSTRVEFDIPVGPFAGSIDQATSAIEPQDGLTTVTVPTGVIRAYARYDNLLVAPLLGSGVSLAESEGVPVIGPGGPVTVAQAGQNPDIVVPPEPVQVKAMAAYFTKPHSKVYKTINCYLSNEVAVPPQVRVRSGSITGGFADFAFYALPAFTRSVKVLRFPDSAGLVVLLHDGVRPVDYITINGGTNPDAIKVIGNENIIGISSGQGTVSMLKLVCEIGI